MTIQVRAQKGITSNLRLFTLCDKNSNFREFFVRQHGMLLKGKQARFVVHIFAFSRERSELQNYVLTAAALTRQKKAQFSLEFSAVT